MLIRISQDDMIKLNITTSFKRIHFVYIFYMHENEFLNMIQPNPRNIYICSCSIKMNFLTQPNPTQLMEYMYVLALLKWIPLKFFFSSFYLNFLEKGTCHELASFPHKYAFNADFYLSNHNKWSKNKKENRSSGLPCLLYFFSSKRNHVFFPNNREFFREKLLSHK
jgi:hypothetical protein